MPRLARRGPRPAPGPRAPRRGDGARADVRRYAFQSSLSGGRDLKAARELIARSRVPRARSVLVDGSRVQSHIDQVTAAPSRNRFLKTLVPFLQRLR